MKDMAMPRVREIVDDFAKEIQDRKAIGPKPSKTVIDFRNDRQNNRERKVYQVPVELLRYRKDNGRIASDVLDYEQVYGILQETKQECQSLLRKFLFEKDREKTDELRAAIKHSGQQEAAVITADGFLINGNRRKMVLELLQEDFPGEQRFADMKVVILPGKNDPSEPPPTLLEIEQIENRYQLQSDGKAEYYGFDRALSIRKKMQLGMTLEVQLRDDPLYAGLSKKDFAKAVKKFRTEFLRPLECIDRYLESMKRPRLYSTIARGLGDPEGRWQAFIDYSQKSPMFADPKRRLKLGITDDEVGAIEQVAFRIIRKRDLDAVGMKAHQVMRDLPKWLEKREAKRELLKIAEVPMELTEEEMRDKDGKEYTEREKDRFWGNKHASHIINQVRKARDIYEHKRVRETPINLLEQALAKLHHDDMKTENIPIAELRRARQIASDIQTRAQELEHEIYDHTKHTKDLGNR